MGFVVAVDGPAGSGKGTITKKIAKEMNLTSIDTGAMYRSVTLAMLNENIALDDYEKISKLLDEIKIEFKKIDGVQKVYLNGKDEIYMQESFGPNEGLYWGKPGEPACEFNGEQAETASLTNCVKTKKDGEGYFGDGFVIPKAGKGSITWYQENDGGKFNAKISIRYSQKSSSTYSYMELYNNDKLLERIKFTDTGSVGFHWREMSVPITIYSGANNITLKSVSNDATPSIDQITILQ